MWSQQKDLYMLKNLKASSVISYMQSVWFSMTLVANISAWVLQLNSISYFNFILSYSDIAGWITEKKYKGSMPFLSQSIIHKYLFKSLEIIKLEQVY